jgi:hypothetical protein
MKSVNLFKVGLLSALAVVVLLSGTAVAQGPTGTITGVVRDASLGIIPDVAVTLRTPATGATRRTITNDAGIYNFPALPPGAHIVSIEKAGFKSQSSTELVLQVQQVLRMDFTMEVGQLSETVEVTAAAPLLAR